MIAIGCWMVAIVTSNDHACNGNPSCYDVGKCHANTRHFDNVTTTFTCSHWGKTFDIVLVQQDGGYGCVNMPTIIKGLNCTRTVTRSMVTLLWVTVRYWTFYNGILKQDWKKEANDYQRALYWWYQRLWAGLGVLYRQLPPNTVVVIDYGAEMAGPQHIAYFDAKLQEANIPPSRSIVLHIGAQTIGHFENYVLKGAPILSAPPNLTGFEQLPPLRETTPLVSIRQAFQHSYWSHVLPKLTESERRRGEERYSALLLGGASKRWRSGVISDLWNIGVLDTALWSYPTDAQLCSGAVRPSVCPSLPKTLDMDSGNKETTVASSAAPLFQQCHFAILFETAFGELPYAYVTEKILKPVFANKPFVAFAPAHYLQLLQLLGFRTFHPIFNETYDTIETTADRKHALYAEITRLGQMPRDFWDQQFLARVTSHNAYHAAHGGLQEMLGLHFNRILTLAGAPLNS